MLGVAVADRQTLGDLLQPVSGTLEELLLALDGSRQIGDDAVAIGQLVARRLETLARLGVPGLVTVKSG